MTSGRMRAGAAAAATVSVLTISAAAFAAAQGGTVRFDGGDAYDEVHCRNFSPNPLVQRNRCKATAEGGHVKLHDVDIHFDGRAAVQVNGGTVDVVSVGGGNATAAAVCVNESGGVVAARSVNVCRSRAQGGAVTLRNVQILIHRRDGTTVTRRRDIVAVANRAARANVACAGLAAGTPTCDARAGGGTMEMRDVDLVESSGRKRMNVDVSVTGGDATAIVRCRNSSSGARVQINVCSASAKGGDAVLQNVRLHAYE